MTYKINKIFSSVFSKLLSINIMEKFIKLFANLFDETDINVFTPQTKFKELEEWSSLIALSVILMVDEEYGITIEGEEMENTSTIEELFNTIKNKIQ